MLQSYKWLLESGSSATLEAGPQLDWPAQSLSQSLARSNNQDNNNIPPALDQQQQQPSLTDQSLASLVGEQQMSGHRKLLANRLNRLAKLGSERSRQLLASLRSTLLMHDEQFSKFRALRLVRPGTQMGGKFTCSVSSLDAEDLQSTRLVVFGKLFCAFPSKVLQNSAKYCKIFQYSKLKNLQNFAHFCSILPKFYSKSINNCR